MRTLGIPERKAILAKIRKLELRHHINVSSIDYDAWTKDFDAKTPELLSVDVQQFENGVRELLGKLKTSHTSFFYNVPDRLLPQHTLNATLRKESGQAGECWMFLDIFEDGAADRAGIKPGHRLLAIDGGPVPLDDVPKFQVGKSYRLEIAAPEGAPPTEVNVEVPSVKGTKAAPPLVPPMTITHRMLEPGLGYLKIGWFTASMGLGFTKELDAAVADLKAQGCKRLIIDLRGNIGGGLGFARLASYLTPDKIAIGQSLTPKRLRSGFKREELPRVPMPSTPLGLVSALARFLIKDKSLVLLAQGLGSQPFHGKVAILINEFTNSAAEMIANFALENKLATVVGTKTCGTVLGARNLDVGSGYWLRLPVFGWFTSNGGTIEGVGVTPQVPVEMRLNSIAAAGDEQLETAIAVVNKGGAEGRTPDRALRHQTV